MKPLIQLIYNSAATCTFSDHDLEVLLRGARSNNANLGVTGMLLYVDGCFFQVLEGPQDVVDQLSEKIKLDSRHSKMTVIIREPISQRSFSDWSMGFTCMSAREAQRIEGLNDFFADGQILTQIDGGRAKKLLKAFGEGRWRVRLATPMIRQPEAVLYAAGQQPQGADFVVKPARNFSFAFQPIINAVTRKVIGYEALLRGLRQEPAAQVLQRVPLDQIAAFDEEACRSAIEAAATMQVQSNLHLNILPMMQGGTPKVFETILRTLEETGFPASRVVLELKHETTVSDPVALASWLKIYRQHGLRISIDDFGSGHAGLALLDHYQPDLISLSMWLVRAIESHGPRQAILRGLVQTCGDLGIDIIAKGVETTEEYRWLRDEGIENFQGFLFARLGFQVLPRPLVPSEMEHV